MHARAQYTQAYPIEQLFHTASVRRHNRVLRGIVAFQAAVIAVLAGSCAYLGLAR